MNDQLIFIYTTAQETDNKKFAALCPKQPERTMTIIYALPKLLALGVK